MIGYPLEEQLRLVSLASLALAPVVHSVELAPDDMGEVLIFPFFIADNGWDSYVSVQAASRLAATGWSALSLRVVLREGRDGEIIGTFNTYATRPGGSEGSFGDPQLDPTPLTQAGVALCNAINVLTFEQRPSLLLAFRLTRFVNGTLQGGSVLANYLFMNPHRRDVEPMELGMEFSPAHRHEPTALPCGPRLVVRADTEQSLTSPLGAFPLWLCGWRPRAPLL